MYASVISRFNERRAAGLEGQEADAGFTLIELMVVLLILAILLAIAIPTFLGVTSTANDRAAQSNLNTGLTDAKSVYENNSQSYYTGAGSLAASVATNEPSLNVVATATTSGATVNPSQMIVWPSADGTAVVVMVPAQKTGNCWFISDQTQSADTAALMGAPWVSNVKGLDPTKTGEIYGVFAYNGTTPCNPASLNAAVPGTGPGQVNEQANAFPTVTPAIA